MKYFCWTANGAEWKTCSSSKMHSFLHPIHQMENIIYYFDIISPSEWYKVGTKVAVEKVIYAGEEWGEIWMRSLE
jgi:hypothetical protein